jgi:hypothetical protein
MALDADDPNLRVRFQDFSHVVENGMRPSLELRAVRVEVDLVEDLEPSVFDDHALLLWATLVFDGARLVDIDDTVPIPVRIHHDDLFLAGHRVAEHADQAPIGISVTRSHTAGAGDAHRKAFRMEVLEAPKQLDGRLLPSPEPGP